MFSWGAVDPGLAGPPAEAGGPPQREQSGRTLGPRFRVEVLPYPHFKGASGQRYIVETMGSGLALLDHDGDGDLDLYLVNGSSLPGCSDKGPSNHLLINAGDGTFIDGTEQSGLADRGYGMGCAVGDIDNDGDPDLYLTNFGSNRLFRNDGGRFTDITSTALVGDSGWGASAAFADLDGDGWLDLYVTNYLSFTVDVHKQCSLGRNVPAYCSPDAYPGASDKVYRNQGDGTFVERGQASALAYPKGKGLGVVCADFDRDGRSDIYVAEDGVPNHLFLNRGDFRFEDATLLAGVGFSESGMAQAGMGVTACDFDQDGWLELFVTNLSAETNVLYRGGPDGIFEDATVVSRLGDPSLLYTGFGTVHGDFDHDGDLDLFVANGHIIDNIREFFDYYDYPQPDRFYRNDGTHFTDVTESWLGPQADGVEARWPGVGRGTAVGDVDGDGDLDLVVTQCDGPPYLYRNLQEDRASDKASGQPGGQWIAFDLVGRTCNRDAIGARVEVVAGGKSYSREITGGGSYLSASPYRVHFGFPAGAAVEKVSVIWPGSLKASDAMTPLALGKLHRIEQAGGDDAKKRETSSSDASQKKNPTSRPSSAPEKDGQR